MSPATQPLADAPPRSDHLTDYDRHHLKTYVRLLDAAADKRGLARGRGPRPRARCGVQA